MDKIVNIRKYNNLSELLSHVKDLHKDKNDLNKFEDVNVLKKTYDPNGLMFFGMVNREGITWVKFKNGLVDHEYKL